MSGVPIANKVSVVDHPRVERTVPSVMMLVLGLLLLIGFGLRLLVWRWHEQYPLGGDEREYFEQALTWLQGKGYHELPLMRPPLYTVFLAVIFQLFDSQVQRVRLVQAFISTATIGLVWLWSSEVFASYRSRAALVAAGIAAVCYTFAANATELLTETIFVAGLTLVFWLLSRSVKSTVRMSRQRWWAIATGLTIGALALVRSVALPLLPLGALWLLLQEGDGNGARRFLPKRSALLRAGFLILGALLVILPWTMRNYILYDTPIIIDTTGAENLWLDNALTDRETVKRQLYAMGEDRGGRQQLAMQEGVAAIVADPARFGAKVWREAQKFFALEYFDDLRARPAIWVPPLEVWLRLLLGDGIWLLVLVAGIAGLWLGPNGQIKWLLVPWVLYVLLTGLLFHVELRYRLPLYPALLPYAGWSVSRVVAVLRRPRSATTSSLRAVGLMATLAAVLALLFLHRNYLAESLLLLRKHYHIAQGWRAYERTTGQSVPEHAAEVRSHAHSALRLDSRSALARVQLGLTSSPDEAQEWWAEAIDAIPGHPYAHLLLGNYLRQNGNDEAARRELAFETRSLEDLQRWSLEMFRREPQERVDIGDGLDLGTITGFYPATDGVRWTRERASVHQLSSAPTIMLRLRSPRPEGASPARGQIAINGQLLDTLDVGNEWQIYTTSLPESLRKAESSLTLTLVTNTFRPRDYDRANGDNRELGVQVDWVATSTSTTTP